ncbi:MAG: NAD kinase, partial [Pseudomonadota bacterium]
SQALDGTWEEYQAATGSRFARRDRIRDATDFMGWYMAETQNRLGISVRDARNQYLAYHEGRTGYARGSYRGKPWLVRVAGEVERTALAINEVSLLRETRQAAKLRVSVDGEVQLDPLVCDGVMVATPAGSTAYNYSAHGPIIPIRGRLLALTPVAPFRPRRWRGALLPYEAEVTIEVLEQAKRPVSATADHVEVRDVHRVDVALAPEIGLSLLHDAGHSLEERIIREQFSV